ncbi:YkyB family protein [Oceanobacillus jeddahense]|uniref:YkyB family protein n=1 Tax=Oceanobacillus jeddahense TaxID=1462527 RepID=UPI00059638CF|nr:YkyB family protein [Oceanobacillus jeddahense]
MKHEVEVQQLAQALFVINKHAKTAPEPKQLYQLKKQAIEQLLKEKKAFKKGLHFSDHPKLSNQHSTVLIKVGDYCFHIPPTKEDLKQLKHLGTLDQSYRNPPVKMSLSHAKRLICKYINWKQEKTRSTPVRKQNSSYYVPSSLGKMDWPPIRSKKR